MKGILATTAIFAFLSSVITLGFSQLGSSEPPASTLKSDEEIQLYPTYAVFDETSEVWNVNLHGKVYEPEESSVKRKLLLGLLRRTIGTRVEIPDREVLDSRMRPFLVDNERGKSVTVQIDGRSVAAGVSGANGHFFGDCQLDSVSPGSTSPSVEKVIAVLPANDNREFVGRIHLIPGRGVSVISDIDDTIKHSQVRNRSELMQNTFLRPFRAVEGMPQLYGRLADEGVAFHYVSGSPWQLFVPLERFVSDSGFPLGTLHLKHFRIKDSSGLGILSSQVETKMRSIEPLLQAFPERKFFLIGDSGEQDPEIYGRVAAKHPKQVIGVFIRNVTGEKPEDPRFVDAFSELPKSVWALFDSVETLESKMDELMLSRP